VFSKLVKYKFREINMFAVIKTGGKQYKVSPGDIIKVEKLDSDVGAMINLSSVMMIGNDETTTVGSPLMDNIIVSATILEQKRSRKIIVYKKKRRQGYDRKKGHRQHLSVLYINEITQDGVSLAKAEPRAPRPIYDTPVAHHHARNISRANRNAQEVETVYSIDDAATSTFDMDTMPAQAVDQVTPTASTTPVVSPVKAKAASKAKPVTDSSSDEQVTVAAKPKAKSSTKKAVLETASDSETN